MTDTFTCDDKAMLVAYLYNDIEAPDRQRVEEHLRQCPACAAEVGALSNVRTELTQWAPPNAELGFTIIQGAAAAPPPAAVHRPESWWRTVPVWAQAIAAILVLAVAAAIANVQVKSGPDGIVVSTGWLAPTPAVAIVPAVAEGEAWRVELARLGQQLRGEIQANRETGTVRAASRSSEVDEATVRRVRELLAASELRQDQELALRVTQLTRDMNIQRRSDLLRVEQAIGHTSVEMAKQRQTVNYLIRASTTPQQ